MLNEVFDGYESDTSETRATAEADTQPSDVQLTFADNTNTPTEQSSKVVTPRRLRSKDRGRHNDYDIDVTGAASSCQPEAESNEFHYPGHIPPLKYISALSRFFMSTKSVL